jgi:uncharacterized SAM-binding protein YcdF (DUF218 family)
MSTTPVSDIVTMMGMVYSLPRVPQVVDGIVLIPGFHESWCLEEGVRAFEGSRARSLLVAGDGIDQPLITLDELKRHGLTREHGVTIQQGALHTRHQADWVVDEVTSKQLKSVAVVASPSHLLRAYLTILKVVLESESLIALIPVPVRVSPETVISRTGGTVWDLMPSEVERISAYQVKGDVATLAQLQEYLQWLWSSSIAEQW